MRRSQRVPSCLAVCRSLWVNVALRTMCDILVWLIDGPMPAGFEPRCACNATGPRLCGLVCVCVRHICCFMGVVGDKEARGEEPGNDTGKDCCLHAWCGAKNATGVPHASCTMRGMCLFMHVENHCNTLLCYLSLLDLPIVVSPICSLVGKLRRGSFERSELFMLVYAGSFKLV